MAPLRLNCPECDAPLTVRDPEALAGKRVKCPKCGTAVRVPEPEDEDDAPKARGPAKAAARRRDEEEDEERPARRKRADEDEEEERPAARRKRAAEDEEEDERPAARRKRASEDDGDEDERPARRKRGGGEDEDRPKKKGKKAAASGNPMLVRNIIGGVVLVAAVTAAVVVWVNRSKDRTPESRPKGDELPVVAGPGPGFPPGVPGPPPGGPPFGGPAPGGPPFGTPNPSKPLTEAEMLKRPADFALDAPAYFAEFKKDQQGSVRKYLGKTVELTGVVKSVREDGLGGPLVELATTGNDIDFVICLMIDRQPWTRLGIGQRVKLKGRVPPDVAGACLYDAAVVEAGPSTTIVLTAEQLSREFAAGAEAAKRKYDKKSLRVSGEVLSASSDEIRAVKVLLKGAGGAKVECQFVPGEGPASLPRPGQAVTVYSEFNPLAGVGDEIVLNSCRLIGR